MYFKRIKPSYLCEISRCEFPQLSVNSGFETVSTTGVTYTQHEVCFDTVITFTAHNRCYRIMYVSYEVEILYKTHYHSSKITRCPKFQDRNFPSDDNFPSGRY